MGLWGRPRRGGAQSLRHEPSVGVFLSLAWGRHSLACGVGQGAGRGINSVLGLGGCASLLHPQALSWRQALRSRLRRAAGAPRFASNLPIYAQVPKPSQAKPSGRHMSMPAGFSCTPDPSPGPYARGTGAPSPTAVSCRLLLLCCMCLS